MYYKIIKDNTIIDIGNTFLVWLKKINGMLACESDKAFYLSTANGKIYETTWLQIPPEGAPRFTSIEAIRIEKEEYEELKEKLLSTESIPVPNIQEIIVEVAPEIKIEPQLLDNSTATQLLQELVKQYAELKKQNQLLEECILEMSQELYK